MMTVSLTVNGRAVSKAVEPRTHLADFVREQLDLTGTHIGCEHGVCGACTMLVDGRPVRSCISYAAACAGSDVRTVEAFDNDPVMVQLRDAFHRRHALQCGYCTPGMLATAYDIVTRLPGADEARVREELAGNLCRCTGYVGIVAAILDVLAHGPHASGLPHLRPDVPEGAALPDGAGRAVVPPAALAAAPAVLAANVHGVTLSRSIDVPVPVDTLWLTLKRIDVIARCLPGANLEVVNDDGSIAGAFAVAIGPMQARFGGRAQVRYDDASHRGEVVGGGRDAASRSQAEGAIIFCAEPESADASRLTLTLTYRLGGPLAQFGRPAIVAGVVDVLLAQFAANLFAASRGEAISAQRPLGGFGVALAALRGMLRRHYSGPSR